MHEVSSRSSASGAKWTRTHPCEPDRALLVVDVHEEEDDARLEVPADVVDDEALADVVDFDERAARRFHRLVPSGVARDAPHVVLDGGVRIPALVLRARGAGVSVSLVEQMQQSRGKGLLTSGELILTERMLASTISSRSQMFSARRRGASSDGRALRRLVSSRGAGEATHR